MLVLVVLHLHLHFGWSRWAAKIKKLKSKPTQWLSLLFVLIFAMSLVAFAHTIPQMVHSPIGAIHGKIGFAFLLFCIGHTIHRRKWVKKQIFQSKKN